MEVGERIQALREVLKREGLFGVIIPSEDPHGSEYVADHWKGREWISGFTGSAGTAVVTLNAAALWVDSRYFIQAADQIKGTEYQLMKLKLPGTPSIEDWLEKVGSKWQETGGKESRVVEDMELLDSIWEGRPEIPLNPVEIHELEYAGRSAEDKLRELRERVFGSSKSSNSEQEEEPGILIKALDDIAWLLNLRGSDVHCNPVFISYLLVTPSDAVLYVDERKISPRVRAYLLSILTRTRAYEEGHALMMSKRYPLDSAGIVDSMKVLKNEVEINGYRKALLRDGVAMVKFLAWLDAQDPTQHTELSVSDKLEAFRAEQELFKGISFDTIAGYGTHGAIVHYEPTPETDIPLEARSFLLLDSGGQYLDGTTDITRTIPLGPLTDEERHVYTLVLKGHIQIELAKFPANASGTQLDVLARQAIWREGLNYLHGTGHGVGSYLNVHEGAHQIRMEYKPAPLRANMILTDEPGIYLEGRFGVRIENTLVIKPYMTTEFGEFLQMESLTLCPIATQPIEIELLTAEEVAWLNEYHANVEQAIMPLLTEDSDRAWLHKACAPI